MPKSSDVLPTVKRLVAEACNLQTNDIHDRGDLIGYGLDSVRVLDLVVAIEKEWNLDLLEHEAELATVTTVSDLAAFVSRHLAEAA